ncbi:MAG: hypothetical protein WD906_00925 [Anaerolineales bacterium]
MKKSSVRQSQPPPMVLVILLGGLGVIAAVVLAGQARRGPGGASPEAGASPTPTRVWAALLQRTPIAYSTPRPEPVLTPIDGTYAKLDPSWPQWWLCLRCADYRPAGGLWRLQFDRGVMRIYYEVTGWRSLASYSVQGDQLYLFNDAYCPDVGVYTWRRIGDSLALEVTQDGCFFQLRGENLSGQVWDDCAPASSPPGCADPAPPQPEMATTDLAVSVYPGDSHYFETPPDLFVLANAGSLSQPEGVEVAYSPTSIAYGVNRVLWWNGPWIEMKTDRPSLAMGVQFLGGPQIGWARILLDGAEVWRGITGRIGSVAGRFGGYVEVSGYRAGPHTLRVESLGSDYRPVEVFAFGISTQTRVDPGP